MRKLLLPLVVVIIFSVQACDRNPSQEQKPNILFFYADDWGRIASVYNDNRLGGICDVVKTPCFDSIAEHGVLFTNAYFPVSQCTPCRASIGTGAYFWRTGKSAFLNQQDGFEGYDAGNEFTGFGKVLSEQNYFMGSSGKTIEKRWSKAQGIPGENGNYRYSLTIYKEQSEIAREAKRKEIIEGYRTTIRNLLSQSEGKPFFFVYGSINTHRPWIRGSGKELWGIDPDALKGKLPEFLPDVPDVREDMADYLGEIQALDLMLQVFIEELNVADELDNTLIIAAGDNGPPGFIRGKTNLYDFSTAAPLMICGPLVKNPGRIVTDFVNLMDLSPTFIDIAGGTMPSEMDGKSIVPLLESEYQGRIDASRDYVVFGRERHVHDARPGNLSYPSRGIRTDSFTYIINSHNERWPQGNPYQAKNESDPKKLFELGINGLKVYKDIDASPTKGWVMSVRDDEKNHKYWEWTFGFRPKEELYKNSDTYQLNNLAESPEYQKIKNELSGKLLEILKETKDPRLNDTFDNSPWTSPAKENITE